MISGWRISSLMRVRSSVTPEIAENSPPEGVVGTVICFTVGAFTASEGPTLPSGRGTARSRSISSASSIPLARHSITDFAPSVIDPPPMVTMRSHPASRAALVAAMTSERGVCGAMLSKLPEQRLPSALRTASISSVLLFKVLDTMRKTFSAPSRRASSATTSAAALAQPPPWPSWSLLCFDCRCRRCRSNPAQTAGRDIRARSAVEQPKLTVLLTTHPFVEGNCSFSNVRTSVNSTLSARPVGRADALHLSLTGSTP